MKEEVNSATGFLVGFLTKAVPRNVLEKFQTCLTDRMTKRYRDHWHPHNPERGSAYRSIVIDHDCIDPLISKAFSDATKNSGISADGIGSSFPKELTLWVDPMDVSYRIGEYGSIGVLYGGADSAATSDYESGSSSVNSSPRSSPAQFPSRRTPSSPSPPFGYRQQPAHSIYHHCGQEDFLHSHPSRFTNRYYNGMQTPVA